MSQVLNTITQQVKAEGKVLHSKTLCQNSSLINYNNNINKINFHFLNCTKSNIHRVSGEIKDSIKILPIFLCSSTAFPKGHTDQSNISKHSLSNGFRLLNWVGPAITMEIYLNKRCFSLNWPEIHLVSAHGLILFVYHCSSLLFYEMSNVFEVTMERS